MGRMSFNIIPRDGKNGEWLGKAAKYDSSETGRYEMFISDYAVDVCEGETQTARQAYCENAAPLLDLWIQIPEFGCNGDSTLGELAAAMSEHIADMDEFYEICNETKVAYETLPLLIERFEL